MGLDRKAGTVEHNRSEHHVYYCSKSNCRKLVRWLIERDFWFERVTYSGGKYVVTCGIEPDRIQRGIGVAIEDAAA